MIYLTHPNVGTMIVRRGHVVSLLEIMQSFKAHSFMEFSRLLEVLASLSGSVEPAAWDTDVLTVNFRQVPAVAVGAFETQCEALDLRASAITLRKMNTLLIDPTSTYGQYRRLVQELQGRLTDEMSTTVFLSLTVTEAGYYNNPRRGWDEIIDRFPDTVSDIEESNRCFALSRYAATVYHSVQIIETGLIDLGSFISVNDPHSGWTSVSNRLTVLLAKKYPERTPFENQNREFLEQTQATVEALKNAWRNKISHSQGRLAIMNKDFTPEIAEEILFATRAFMRRLVTGLPPRTTSE